MAVAGDADRRRVEGTEVLSTTPAAPIEVREATPADLEFVRRLDIEVAGDGIPSTRDLTADEARRLAAASYDDPDVVRALAERFVTLIAEERTEGGVERLGFIRLDLASIEPSTGEPQCFIDQLAVVRAHWGRRVARRLVEGAARLAAERGLTYLVGVVSATDTWTLDHALSLGFAVERHQIVMRCEAHRAGAEGLGGG